MPDNEKPNEGSQISNPADGANTPSAKKMTSAKDIKSGIEKDGIKGTAAKKLTSAATSAAPEGVQKAAETAQKAATAVQNVGNAVAATKSAVASTVAVLVSPVTWIVVAIVLVVAIGMISIIATVQTVGRNENADGCYGIGGNSGAGLQIDDSEDWSARANSAGSWLMSNQFDFLGGKGMTKNQAAGVMGNFIAESGITFAQAERKAGNQDGSKNKMSNAEADAWTKGTDPRGLGLAQWTWNPGRAKDLIDLANSMSKDWHSAEVQLSLIKVELDGPYYGSKLLAKGFNDASKTPEELTTIFHNVYEGSADRNMDNRHKAANDFLSVFTGGGSSSGGSCVMGASNVDTSSVVGLAVSMSYGTSAESRVSPGDTYGTNKAKAEYKEAKSRAMAISKDPMANLYASCDRFVATVMKLTLDEDIPWGSTAQQGTYLASSPKWQQYTKKSDAQPGDIWITKSRGHVIIYIGEHNGVDSIAHASYLDRVAGIGSSNYLNENLVDLGGRAYYGYRFVG